MDQKLILVVIAVVVLAALAAWMILTRQRTSRLRTRFGPEYDRTMHRAGDQRRAEAELEAREKRVAKIEIRRLGEDQQRRFVERWLSAQKRFVDAPREAVGEADHLVREVMSAQGYPVADFEQRAADLSVHHAAVVTNYRAARAIAERSESGQANTEDLRKAVVYYRDLFEDLLEMKPAVMAGGAR